MSPGNIKNVGSAAGSPVQRQRRPPIQVDEKRNTWNVAEAAAWAGIPTRTLYNMLRAEIGVPCVLLGKRQEQSWPKARNGKRKRACFRYMIPRKAFINYWETLSEPTTAGALSRPALPKIARPVMPVTQTSNG